LEERVLSGKAHLPKSIFKYDFAQLAKKERNKTVKLRLLALYHLQSGKGYQEVANLMQITRQSLNNWVYKMHHLGIKALFDNKADRGAKRKVPIAQEEAFKTAILELQNNCVGGRIRGKDVQALMEKKLGVDCTLDTVYKTLRRINFVWITARSRHPKSDIGLQEAFKKTSH